MNPPCERDASQLKRLFRRLTYRRGKKVGVATYTRQRGVLEGTGGWGGWGIAKGHVYITLVHPIMENISLGLKTEVSRSVRFLPRKYTRVRGSVEFLGLSRWGVCLGGDHVTWATKAIL